MGALETLRTEGGVIAQAPWSFAICLVVIGGVIFLVLRSLKSQEISDLNSRLVLRNDEIADYRRKLDGASPDQAKQRLEALEREISALRPRRITPDQKEACKAELLKAPSAAMIFLDGGAARSASLYRELKAALDEAGWRVSYGQAFGVGNPPENGVGLTVQDPQRLTPPQAAVIAALHAADLVPEIMAGPLPIDAAFGQMEVQIMISDPSI